jgi:pimeloyl-ACP methyl ester carboxylesterase
LAQPTGGHAACLTPRQLRLAQSLSDAPAPGVTTKASMSTSVSAAMAPAPDWLLLGTEPVRALFEYTRMRFASKAHLPQGDGHPVVIFPGLAADSRSIGPLKQFCEELGYATHDWGRGFNTGPHGDVNDWIDALAQEVDARVRPDDEAMSLIGWSLGGIYARELAKKLRGRVRQVITIGTPFAGLPEQTNAGWVFRLINGQTPPIDPGLLAQLRVAPPVPTTSLYSRCDGIVAWQACIQGGRRDRTENIEVSGSHCGMGWNTEVLAIIADRLAQPSDAWQCHPASDRALRAATGRRARSELRA